MLQIFRYLFFIFNLLFFTNSIALESKWSSGVESQIRLISPITANDNKVEIYLGLEYQLQDGWKTYWKSPGEGGFPQEINWDDSINIKSVEVEWPTPKKFEILGMQSIGYENKIIFPLKINLINPNVSTKVDLFVNYLVCKDICIPGNANLVLIIPAGFGELTEHSFSLEKSISKIPLKFKELSLLKEVKANIFYNENKIIFLLNAKAKGIFKKPEIFLHTRVEVVWCKYLVRGRPFSIMEKYF